MLGDVRGLEVPAKRQFRRKIKQFAPSPEGAYYGREPPRFCYVPNQTKSVEMIRIRRDFHHQGQARIMPNSRVSTKGERKGVTMPSKQAPVHSGFGPTTTARQTLRGIDLSGKVAVVTGGYSGIGLETTRALAEAGATVIVPARTPDKARQALSSIPRVEQGRLDLLDSGSIDAFANGFLATRHRCTCSSTTPASWQRR
jgi:hypothetical protein